MRRVILRCSAPYSCTTNELIEEINSFINAQDPSERRQNVVLTSTVDLLEARLFFVDVPTRFYFKDNVVTIEVDSTMTGPGYHASSVRVLDYIGQSIGIEWDYSTLHDDTGYYEHRDFKKLQKYMEDWLVEYCNEFIANPPVQAPVRTTALIMPYGMLPSNTDYFACHTLGYLYKDFFTDINNLEDKSLFCRSFFIWWDQELDAEFYVKCALSIIWCRLNWLPPVLEEELLDFDNVMYDLETAWQMDKTLPLPVSEWIELAKLSNDKELIAELIRRFPTAFNQPPSRGYRRHDVWQIIGERCWAVKLPGKMHSSVDEDGALMFWDHQGRSICITASSCSDYTPTKTANEFLNENIDNPAAKPFLLPSDLSLSAFIVHEQRQEKNTTTYSTTLYAATDGHMVIITLYYKNPNDKVWALSICNSLRIID
ncbi:hypothetical protein LJB93_02150 [Desulfovibrio sp. OttesenSCG-928-F07]|nr:hypothetical protein [Desulfovibrio sp. OttesenSCG-928-F07]